MTDYLPFSGVEAETQVIVAQKRFPVSDSELAQSAIRNLPTNGTFWTSTVTVTLQRS